MVKQTFTGTAMFANVDAYLVQQSNRLATWLQEDHGLTMPGILAHAAMATIVSTGGAIVAMLMLRSPVIAAVMLLFGTITIRSLWPLMLRYQRDAERGWNHSLARDYAVRAIGAQEGQRDMRRLGLGIAAFVLALSTLRTRPTDVVDLLTIMLVVSSIAHLYFACAEPKPPGTRRQQHGKLAFQGSV